LFPGGLRDGPGGHRRQAAGSALSFRALAGLDQGKNPNAPTAGLNGALQIGLALEDADDLADLLNLQSACLGHESTTKKRPIELPGPRSSANIPRCCRAKKPAAIIGRYIDSNGIID
jgi:hypothetical protein